MIDVKVLKSETAESGSIVGAPRFSRRRALAKLGLTAAAIYVAPTLLALTPAGASEGSGGSGGGSADTADSSSSAPSAGSTPSAASEPSTASGPSGSDGDDELLLVPPA